MAKYSIQDTTLTAIGDAIRGVTGEYTRVEQLPKEVYIFKSPNVNSLEEVINFDIYQRTGVNKDVQETFTIPGATKIILQAAVKAELHSAEALCFCYTLSEYSGDVRYNTSNADINGQVKTYEIIGDTITIGVYNGNYTSSRNAYYFEAHGYDEDGNLVKDENTLVDTNVFNSFTPAQMAEEIDTLYLIPEEAFLIEGDATNLFRYHWKWFLRDFKDKIITKNLTNINYFFADVQGVDEVSFDLNIANKCSSIDSVFMWSTLKSIPYIKGELLTPTGNYSNNPSISSVFDKAQYVRYIPDDYFDQFGGEAFWQGQANYSATRDSIFAYCTSLRGNIPSSFKNLVNKNVGTYSNLYYTAFSNCCALDEITNIPVNNLLAVTSNLFAATFGSCYRLKNITFETNEDGTPKTAQWKSQTLELSVYVGYGQLESYLMDYNAGLTRDKKVVDDATYQALKDDPDWYTLDINYSRYNHDSAVATINSLPDTSEYLASAGGVNTIKFKGASGALTDGGAINTLTEEEIAVAAAKGWTVTLV